MQVHEVKAWAVIIPPSSRVPPHDSVSAYFTAATRRRCEELDGVSVSLLTTWSYTGRFLCGNRFKEVLAYYPNINLGTLTRAALRGTGAVVHPIRTTIELGRALGTLFRYAESGHKAGGCSAHATRGPRKRGNGAPRGRSHTAQPDESGVRGSLPHLGQRWPGSNHSTNLLR